MKKHFIKLMAAVAVLAVYSCSSDEIVQNTENPEKKATEVTTSGTVFEVTNAAVSRSSMAYSNGAFHWEKGDKIFVKDDDGRWQESTNAVGNTKLSSFKFYVPGKFKDTDEYEVVYYGQNGSLGQATIEAQQTQSAPNNTEHFGNSGDCGIAVAQRDGNENRFNFKLDHQAAYLVFLPFTKNSTFQGCKLTKVEVESDNEIAGTYDLNPYDEGNFGLNTSSYASNSSKTITLTTGDGFPLTNTEANVTTNGAFMVIAPGAHTLRIRYWIKGTNPAVGKTPAQDVEGCITMLYKNFDYEPGKYYDMTANLDIRAYSEEKTYSWDSEVPLSTVETYPGFAGPNGTSARTVQRPTDDPHFPNYDYPGNGVAYEAQGSVFKRLPNVNEMIWYADKDKGEMMTDNQEIFTFLGRLFTSGGWLKKARYIEGFNDNYAPDGVDYRTHDMEAAQAAFQRTDVPAGQHPALVDANKYFYLPALGSSTDINRPRNFIGQRAVYWTSTSYPSDKWSTHLGQFAYRLNFYDNRVAVGPMFRIMAAEAVPFK